LVGIFYIGNTSCKYCIFNSLPSNFTLCYAMGLHE
jgi:hypothetical protein